MFKLSGQKFGQLTEKVRSEKLAVSWVAVDAGRTCHIVPSTGINSLQIWNQIVVCGRLKTSVLWQLLTV